MKIRFRLLLLAISAAVIAMSTALFISSSLTKKALESSAMEMLSAVLEMRHRALLTHLDTTQRELHVLAASPTINKSLKALSEGYAKLGENAQALLRRR